MRTADEIRATRLREACCTACSEKTGPCKRAKVSADHPPKGDGGIEVQSEEDAVNPFVARAAKAILEGREEPAAPEPDKSPALSRALAGLRAGLRRVSG